jgi:predicted dehydrogenase
MLHGWRCFKENGGGMVLDWGVHLIDQMLLMNEEPLIEVDAHLHNVISDEVDDVFAANFRFESGLSYLVNVSMNCFISQPRWHVCSKDGTMIIEDWDANGKILKNKTNTDLEWADTIVYTSAGPTRSMAPRPIHTIEEVALPVVKKDCFATYYANIDEVVAGKAKNLVTPEQMLRVMKTIDLVFQSQEEKQGIRCHL